ncbi:MAG: SDR family oxidoreductase [Treponema sp.]|jgi:nucleoside-diphosphate-sugar epimerase|nr:SDR family oxidoreductase [Treponema sp.]
MKALFIGGTGTISAAITKKLIEKGWELTLLNRGNRKLDFPSKLREIHCNIEDRTETAKKLEGLSFDVVVDFIVYTKDQAERDYRLFRGKTGQYIFISSTSAYQKPPGHYLLNEGTPHSNPYWQYSRDKIACEEFFMTKYREENFPVTIVMPSHTYDERSVPLGLHGVNGSWQVLKRMLEGKQVIIHGDGSSLWTMTHNSDFAEGFIGLMGNIHATGEMVHITSDETLTWNQIYRTIANALGVPLKALHISSEFLNEAGRAAGLYDFEGTLTGDKANSVVFDNSKIKRLVPRFTAAIRFDQGVKMSIDYILAHKECQKDDPDFDAWCDRVIAARGNALAELESVYNSVQNGSKRKVLPIM